MKTYKEILTIISGAVVLAVGNPAFAQEETAPSQPGVVQDGSLATDPSLSAPRFDTNQQSSVPMQESDRDRGIEIDDPAGAATDARDWGWLGLLGLVGLFGLKRTREEKTGEYRTSKA